MVPKSLKNWFLIHFAVDLIAAVPLIFFTPWVVSTFSLEDMSFVALRLVGAALLGIGGTSFVAHNAGLESYKNLLVLKIIWSTSAIFGLTLSLMESYSLTILSVLIVFAVFSSIWARNFIKLRKL